MPLVDGRPLGTIEDFPDNVGEQSDYTRAAAWGVSEW